MDTLTQLKSFDAFQNEVKDSEHTTGNPGTNQHRFNITFLRLMVIGTFLLFPAIKGTLFAQSSTCQSGMVQNGNGDLWSEECWLNDTCGLQGNPCNSKDVKIISIYLGDANGDPLLPCNVGDPQNVMVWAFFNNSGALTHYAIRTRTEVWLNGIFNSESNTCTFDSLTSGQTKTALLGTVSMNCGDQLQLLNTWIAWNNIYSQCSMPQGSNYANECNDYSPARCSKDLSFLDLLSSTFSFTCTGATPAFSNVCFTSSVFGGTPPYSYAWDFGDSGSSIEENPCHNYSTSMGSYIATLTVTDDLGYEFSIKNTVNLNLLVCPTLFTPPAAPPTVDCAVQTTPIDCPATPTFIPPTVTDSCGGSVTITFTDVTTPGACPEAYSVTRTWTASDTCGNSGTCSATIEVQDITPPTISCVAQTTPINCPATPAFTAPTVSDACDISVDITFSDVTTPGTCPGTYSVARTWIATDDCENTATCSATIVVQDNIPPTITCVTQVTPLICPGTPVFTPPSVSDACDVSVDITFSDVTTPGICSQAYSVTRTWLATDDCGNTSTCSRTIDVIDDLPPSITCPMDITIECGASTDISNTGNATGTDNCGGVTIAHGDFFGAPPTTVPEMHWEFLPPGTNSGSCISGTDCATGTICFALVYTPGVTGTLTSYTTGFFLGCDGINSPIVSNVSCVMGDNSGEIDDCGGTGIILMNSSGNTGNVAIIQNVPIVLHQVCLHLNPGGMILLDEDEATDLTTSVGLPGGGLVTETPAYINFTASFDTYCNPPSCVYPLNIYREFLAIDDCGNQSSCVQNITVQDMTPPVLTCATQTTPINCPATPTFVAPTVTDACDPSVVMTFSDVTTPGSCPGTYSVTRTWSATDDCLNTGTCSATIVVQDVTPPTITCVAQTTPITCPNTPVFTPPTASDGCDGNPTITFSDVTTPSACPEAYSVTRTWTATDACGNTATCNATIVVEDLTPPTITCMAQTTPISCPGPIVFTSPTATDICDPSVDITFSDVTTPSTCSGNFSVTRTWTASDACGNTATCSATIDVQDLTPPTITCVAQTTPVSCPAAPVFTPPTVTDACDGTVTVTFTDATTPGTCPGNMSVARTWTATDACGNSATCSATIEVQDITSPTITCATQTTPVDCPGTPTFTPPTVTDACDGTVTVTFSDVTTPGTCPNTYSVDRTWLATDACGNTATCSATIVVQDLTPPTITCVAQTTPIECPGTPTFNPPTVTDACDGAVILTFSDVTTPGACTNTYSVDRTWLATDACGNTATCSATIVVEDLTPPTITCVAQTTPIECPETPTFNPPTVSDSCDGTVTVTFSDATTPGTCSGNMSVTRTWTATDACGNSASCSATIMVEDITSPTIMCAAQTTPINCPATPAFTAPTVTDTCDPNVTITFSDETTPGPCPGAYRVARTWLATDACGNTATCSAFIVVEDLTPPMITCAIQITPIDCPATPVFNPPTVTDACDGTVTVTFSDVTTPGTCANTYSVARTWLATDACGNSATCIATIVVQDVTPPTITCATQTTPISCPSTPAFIEPTVTDACDGTVTLTFSDVTTPGACTNTYSVDRTWLATDACGNSATCSATIVVEDITPPTITCATQTTPIACPAAPVFNPPTVSDSCDGSVTVTFSDATTPGTCPGNMSVTRTWLATDACGNTATCSATIVVEDLTPPTITCVAQTTPVECPGTPAFNPPTVTDACDGTVTLTFSDVTTPGTCTNTYSVDRTWLASDACGNTATCSATIVVEDLTPPTITCVAQTTPVECPGTPAFNPPTVTDACDGTVTVTFSDVTTPGTCPNTYSVDRTWLATDACGNTATCSATIVVQDLTPPTITCAAQTTPVECPGTPAFNPPTVTDACDGNVTLTFSDVTTPGTCTNTYSVDRTWLATDACGNSATCSASIVVQDVTPPTITCAIQTTPIACPGTPTFTPPTVSDACDGTVMLTFSDVTTAGTCANTYSVARTWLASDACGNSATCSATIVVEDITPPTITCVAQTSPIDCPAAPAFNPPTVSDSCDGTVTVTFTDATTPGNCPGNMSVTRTWLASDDCGNTATCSATVVVQDLTPPTITCATQTTPIACPATPTFTPPTVTDACDGMVTVTFTDVTTPGTCPGNMSVTRTWSATDACGNSATCSGTIVVEDITPPTITCATQTTPISCPATPTFTPPTVTDACDGTVTVTFSDVTTAGTCPNTYSVSRTWLATDACGNTATCSATIVVQDITPPTITCATQTTPVDCPATPVFTPPTATDACDLTVTITFSDVTTAGTCPNTYSVARTWLATDDCGNTATCSATIAVQDITPPLITCPPNITIECGASTAPGGNNGIATATDLCDAAPTITSTDFIVPNAICSVEPSIMRTWRATDACGNSSTCVQTISIDDTQPPVVQCPPNVTVGCWNDVPDDNTGLVMATDNCSNTIFVVHVVDQITQMGCVNRFTVTRIYRVTDECGNSTTCSQLIVVNDIIPPTIVCPLNVTVQCAADVPPQDVSTVGATDNCGLGLTLKTWDGDVTSNMTCANQFTVTRTYRATDACGNSATCAQIITVFDNTTPTITCATQTTPISCPATPVFSPPTTTDNCAGTVTVTFSDVTTAGTCPNTYSVARTWTASDVCGNTATCSATIVVQDLTPPTITCVTQTTPINCPAAPVFTPPTVTDVCDGTVTLTFSDVTTPGTCPNTYSVARTWLATDDCGNSATCSATIVVQDITPPTITCATQTTPIECPAMPAFTAPTVTDACDGTVTITFSDVTTPGTCANTYSVARTWLATDDCGNTATCSATIAVQDITPPTITCATQTTPVDCPATPVFTPPTATDTCDPSVTITFSDVTTPGTCPNTYSVTRTWSATDACGNSSSCSGTIVVQDITPPTVTCATQTTPIACPATPAFTPPTVTDACDGTVTVTFSDVTTAGTCPNTYSVARTWLATDDCGNTATCSATIVVQDITPPTITCVAQTSPIDCPATPVFTPPTATDACDASVTITFSDVTTPGNCPNTYSVTRTWSATDACGNSSSCSGTIVVQDITPPTIVCALQNSPIECPAMPVFTPPTATDACDPSVTITFSDVTTQSPDCSNPGTYFVDRTWTATDDCGNSATCSRTIQVVDTTPPTITCATQTTPINCPATPVFIPPTATDTCDPTVTITFSDVTTAGTCPNTYSVARTWTATDDCANTATCSAAIVVQDITPPTITCATQTTPVNCPAAPVFTAPTATDTCDPSVTITFSDVTTPGTCPNTYSVARTWLATDDCGNSASCSAIIVVQDITPPTITCATQTTPIACPATPVFTPPTVSDACDGTVTVTFSDATTPGTCPNTYSVARTWLATDDCGNTATCSATIVVQDITPPTITCAAQETPISCPALPVFIPPTATDACDPSVTVTFSDVTTPGTCPGNFIVTRTWRATDDCGNSATCSSTIVSLDIIPPVIICAIQISPIQCPNAPVFMPPTVTDACDPSVTITFSDVTTPHIDCPNSPNTYDVTRTWTATDDCGNTSTCSRTILVIDTTPPTITCAAQTTPIDCPATPVFIPPTATDSCDPSVTVTFADVTVPGSCPNTYNVTRIWVATDDCFNTAACSATIVVQDITPPTITCVAQTTPVNCPAAPVFTPPTATDACDPSVTITFSDVTTPGSCPNTYSVTRTWRATDACGNSATCTGTILVQDITPPTITCATQTTPIECPAMPAFTAPTVTDACDGTVTVTFSDVTTPGTCANTYSVARTWLATDDCGNSATCSATIVVQDITPPTIMCATQTSPVDCPATPVFTPPTATDTCDPSVTITFSDVTTPGSCPQAYSVTRTWRATDACGNSSSCSGTIVVQDITPPTITCPPNITIECSDSSAPGGNNGTATATDVCDATPVITSTDAIVPGSCIHEFTIMRTWRAADACGNSSTCVQTISVDDTQPPMVQCPPDVTVGCWNDVPPDNPGLVMATDNCSITIGVSHVIDFITQMGCVNRFSITRVYRATDECGNSATCTQLIVVNDTIPPAIVCPPAITVQCAADVPPQDVSLVGATDNCGLGLTLRTWDGDVITNMTCDNQFTVTRTYRATDACGNSATCAQIITVFDNTPPTITCVAQTTPVTCPAMPVFTPPTATDNCVGTVTMTFSDVTTPGTCPQSYSVTRTWRATDVCGNSATCTGTIVVQDITPPTITCVAQTTPIDCPAMPVFTPPTATDACDASVTITFSDVTTPGACPQAYSVTRTWRATDACGNSSTCTGTVVVQDITPPTVTCVAQTTPVNCPAMPVFTPPTATDACDPSVTITFADVTTPGTCPSNYSVTRTWSVMDACGNSSTCSATIAVQDITPPTITCATQITPIDCPAMPVFTAPTATDACDPSVTVTFSDVTTPGTCPNTYSVTRTWRATDVCGNSSSCSGTIVVQDITPPTITCATQTSPIDCPAMPVFTAPTATDACDASVTVTFADVTTSGTCPNTYSVTRTWRATDACGNSSSCSGTIVVQDITPPTITCVAQTTPVNCPAMPVFTPPTATDACDPSVTITFTDVTTPGSCTQNYSITRTWRATDACGNSSSCSGTIVVQDITPPTITCVAQMTPIECPAMPVFTPPTATDSCDPSVTITFSDVTTPGACPQAYSVTRTWRATDACGNSATCTGTIVVQDITPPAITCVTQITPINCPAMPVFTPPTATDACDPSVTITFSDVTTQGTCPSNYSVTRTWSVMDACGNSSTCSATIAVQDITPPTITCATQITPINCPAAPVFTAPTATDACDASVTVTFSDVTTPGTCPSNYSVTRTWRATDVCGNSSSCSGTIVVQDITPPTITCATQTSPIDCPAMPVFTAPTATDACDASVTVTFADVTTPGTCPNTYSVTRTWRATDVCGNSSSCSGTIVVQDITPPTITCVAQTTPVNCPAMPVFTPPTATDACSSSVTITFTDVTTSGSCSQNYSITRTWRATDACGNSSSCSGTIVVQDITPPTITCVAQTSPVNCPASPVFTPPTATDTCDPSVTITFSDVTTPGTCSQNYSVTRTWRATDHCGNSSSCSGTIVVQDITPPTITCVTQISPINCPGTPTSFVAPTATDSCDPNVTITFSDVTTPGSCPNNYSVTRTWRATDACGNSSTCSGTIVAVDITPPTITCATQVTPINCPAAPVFTPPTATDTCDPSVTLTFSDVTTPGTCPQTFSVTRTWRATDACGNSSSCSGTIVVQDITPPTITCATQTSPINCPAAPVFTPPTVTDACDQSVTITFSDVTTPGTCPQTFSVTRTWRATDACGNSSSCSGTILVQDITPPTITCATQTSPINCPASPVFTPPTATDTCDPSVTITFSDVTTPGTCPQNFSVTRTWRATDACGNSSSCSGTIVVQDITPPTITCPQPVTVVCASQVPPSNIASVTTSDACDPAPIVTFVSDVTVNQTCVNRYMVNRTYSSTDHCGNSATCIQVITVFDNVAPSITCPVAITVQCASLVPTPNIASVTTSDNCTGPVPVVSFVSDITTNQTCVNRYTLTRTYRSTDACGNSATCTQVITVFDNTPPTITCPANITVQCASQVPVPNPASVTTSDNCTGPAPVVTFVSDVTTNQTCINRYTLTRTYRSTDACGNSATCTQVITVFDNTPPTITPTNPLITNIPNNGTLEIQCFGQDPNWDLPNFGTGDVSASDNCTGTVVLTYDDVLIDEGNCPVDGYINRYRLRWTATDACGNSSSLTIFLNLIDTIPPVINDVPEDITVNCDEVPDAPTLSATDECLCACVVELQQDGPHPGCQDGQIITRTWEATDYCGNVTIEQQHITLVDHEGPVLTIEEPLPLRGLTDGTVLEYTCNEGGIPAYFDDLSAESVSSPPVCDGLPKITFEQNEIFSINCERFGYIQERSFTWTGIDACGNVTTLTITAHLIDNEPPVITGVPDIACVNDPALDLVDVTDNCDRAGLIHWDVPIPNPCGNGKAILRTYEAQDLCGNYSRDTVILIPNDGIPPTIVFTNPDLIGLGQGEYISVECDKNGSNYTPWGPDDVSIDDDCPGATLDFQQTTMQVYDSCQDGALLWLRLTWTATDLCGNSSSLFLYVYVKDETPPVFDPYHAEATIGCNDDWPIIGAIDNCGTVTITEQDSVVKKYCEFEYDIKRTLTAVDACGNTAIAIQLLHVGDHSGPDITGIDTLVCNDLSIPDVTAWDPCAQQYVPVTMTEVSLDEGCPGLVIQRTWSATDGCGNVAMVTQRIIIGDTVPPIILVPTWSIIRKFQDNDHNFVRLSERDIIKQLNALNESSVYAVDLCDLFIVPVFTVDITLSENCLTDGWWQHRVYTWVATDACGNSTVLTFSVDIIDDLSPEIFDAPADQSVICGELPDPPTVHAHDDSGDEIAEYIQTITEIPGEPGHFRVIRTWTAIDPCGNSAVATQSILWIPNTFVDCEIILPPVVDCNSHGVIIGSDLGGGIPPFTYVWDVIGQECFIQSGQGTSTITIYVGFFDVTISLTVTDAYGCQSVCTAVLDCFDPLDQFAGNPPSGNQVNLNAPNNTIQGSNQDYLHELTYWPNPANTVFNVSFDAKDERDVQISFMNFLGEVVLTDHMKSHIGANTHKIDVTKLPEGTYLFQVKTDKEVHAKGIVILR